jgi:hypothetical protein
VGRQIRRPGVGVWEVDIRLAGQVWENRGRPKPKFKLKVPALGNPISVKKAEDCSFVCPSLGEGEEHT